jgi:hypothetical protein
MAFIASPILGQNIIVQPRTSKLSILEGGLIQIDRA